jgi:acyl-CoA reductase-like NAD-dependent aldehyde dehydrogenase
MKKLEHFIGGRFVASNGDRSLPDVNPSDATDQIAEVPEGTVDDVKAAAAAASEAFEPWRSRTSLTRAEVLYRWAEVISSFQEALAQAVCREVGKPISEARGEAARGVAILRYYAGEAVHPSGEVIPSQFENALQFTVREPLGVVGAITPWNFPLAIPLWKLAPALAFGNAVVWKASELSSHVSTLLTEMGTKAGLPAGVLNLVLGTGEGAGEALLQCEGIHALSFTGSSRVGAHIAGVAAHRGIRYQTEMGGKNAAIVLKDADLDRAASVTAAGAMRYAGQKCTATSRVIVAKEIAKIFWKKLEQAIQALPIGPVDDPKSAVGPVITEASRERLQQIRKDLVAEDVFEVPVPSDPRFLHGFFYPPTVVYGARPDSFVATNELFGPILAALEAEDLDDAVHVVNSSPYGLSTTVFTCDLHSVLSYIRRIEAGMVRVNGDTTGVDPHAPFGGTKKSSSGSREQGTAAREFYTEIKTIQIQG